VADRAEASQIEFFRFHDNGADRKKITAVAEQ